MHFLSPWNIGGRLVLVGSASSLLPKCVSPLPTIQVPALHLQLSILYLQVLALYYLQWQSEQVLPPYHYVGSQNLKILTCFPYP